MGVPNVNSPSGNMSTVDPPECSLPIESQILQLKNLSFDSTVVLSLLISQGSDRKGLKNLQKVRSFLCYHKIPSCCSSLNLLDTSPKAILSPAFPHSPRKSIFRSNKWLLERVLLCSFHNAPWPMFLLESTARQDSNF